MCTRQCCVVLNQIYSNKANTTFSILILKEYTQHLRSKHNKIHFTGQHAHLLDCTKLMKGITFAALDQQSGQGIPPQVVRAHLPRIS